MTSWMLEETNRSERASESTDSDPDRTWLIDHASAGDGGVIWDPNFREFLSDAFFGDLPVEFWNSAPLTEVICEFLAATPAKPILEGRRFVMFSGCPRYGGSCRGLLWVDCAGETGAAVFAAVLPDGRGFKRLVVYLGKSLRDRILPTPFLAAMYVWLRVHYPDNVISMEVRRSESEVHRLNSAVRKRAKKASRAASSRIQAGTL